MSRTDIIHSITHASFFTRQKHCFDYPGEIPTEGQCCPVTGCTYNTSDLTASKAASHIHACVKAAIGREVWIKYEEHFCLKTCPWQGCLHLIFDNAIQAAEHFFVKHVNGPAVSIKCAVQLEDGVCDAPYPNSEKGRVRHLEIYHGIIALSMTWGGKKDDPPIPTLDSRIACCSECKIWIKGYAAMHMHADSHLQADLPQMRQDMLLCQTDFTYQRKSSAKATQKATDRCPFELFSEALSPMDR